MGRSLANPFLDQFTDPCRDLTGLIGRGVHAGTDGPDGLVGNHKVPDLLRGQTGQGAGQLALQDGPGLPLLPLLQRLADAGNHF